MMAPQDHLRKAAVFLDQARYLCEGAFHDGAGRDAYLAALHAALAYIGYRTGTEPKTHSGARSEFARLSRDDDRIDPTFRTYLAHGYSMKTATDYDQAAGLSRTDAQVAIDEAARMTQVVESMVSNPAGTGDPGR